MERQTRRRGGGGGTGGVPPRKRTGGAEGGGRGGGGGVGRSGEWWGRLREGGGGGTGGRRARNAPKTASHDCKLEQRYPPLLPQKRKRGKKEEEGERGFMLTVWISMVMAHPVWVP